MPYYSLYLRPDLCSVLFNSTNIYLFIFINSMKYKLIFELF